MMRMEEGAGAGAGQGGRVFDDLGEWGGEGVLGGIDWR